MLIYQMFVKLLSWMVLRTRSDAAKEIEILVLRHQLAVLQRPAGAAPIALPTASAQPVHRASSDPTPAATDRGRGVQIDNPEMVQAPRSPGGPSGSCRAGHAVATRRAQEVSGGDGVPPIGAPTQLTASTIANYGLVNTAKVPAREVAMTGVAITAVTVGLPRSQKIDEIHYAAPTSMIPTGRSARRPRPPPRWRS